MGFLTVENTVQDIGGADVKTWLALVHSLGLAAVAPFAGAVSDLIGRRYPAIFGTILIIVGMAVVGTAHRMDVAIGGMAIGGVGAGVCQTIGLSGIAELVPVNQRGRYIGTVFMLFSPMAASTAYCISPIDFAVADHSTNVFGDCYMEMGCLDPIDLFGRGFGYGPHSISSSASHKLDRLDSISSHCSSRLRWRSPLYWRTRSTDGRTTIGRLQ